METNNGMEGAFERLAVATAMSKALNKVVTTKPKAGEPSLRYECDEALRRMYEQDGVDRIRMKVNGCPVGTMSVALRKGGTARSLVLEDGDEFEKWLAGDGLDVVKNYLVSHLGDFSGSVLAEGVVPDGCSVNEVQIPDTYRGSTIRVDERKVVEALGKALPDVAVKLLEEGE